MLKDFERGGFRRVHTVGEIDLLMSNTSKEALVVWPWWSEADEIRAALTHAHSMGFTDITETGNYGWHDADVDCDDWDYSLVVAR